MIRTLIVDDSPEDLLNLRSLLEAMGNITIVGTAVTLSEARIAAAIHAPDLVFLDVELGNENGFDLLGTLHKGSRVIFTTVHTGYGAAAFEVAAADSIVTVFNISFGNRILKQIEDFVEPVSEERLLRALARLRSPDHLPVTRVQVYRGGSTRHELALEAIAAIKADRDYSIVI